MEQGQVSGHGATRAIERMTQAGLDAGRVLDLATQVAAHAATDTAVLMVTLPERAGDDRDDVLTRESNGNEVWTIIRNHRVITLMLRRDDQPKTITALRVKRVVRLTYAGGAVRAIDLK